MAEKAKQPYTHTQREREREREGGGLGREGGREGERESHTMWISDVVCWELPFFFSQFELHSNVAMRLSVNERVDIQHTLIHTCIYCTCLYMYMYISTQHSHAHMHTHIHVQVHTSTYSHTKSIHMIWHHEVHVYSIHNMHHTRYTCSCACIYMWGVHTYVHVHVCTCTYIEFFIGSQTWSGGQLNCFW